MTQTIAIEKVSLAQLEESFDLEFSNDAHAFTEWNSDLPELSADDLDRIQRIKAIYANLERRPILENTVKMAIAGPLLDLAGFFLPPFSLETETSVEICASSGELTLRGRIDALVVLKKVWVLVIESKRSGFSLEVGIPQALSYMLASRTAQENLYGMVTNGRHFMFLKLVRGESPKYSYSQEFVLNRGDDLEQVLRIMKRLGAIALESSNHPPSSSN